MLTKATPKVLRWQRSKYSPLARQIDVFAAASKFLFYLWWDGLLQNNSAHTRRIRAHWLVNTLLDLGPTFIKIGQSLSTRADLLPLEYVKELEQLQDRVPEFSSEEAIAQAKCELLAEMPADSIAILNHDSDKLMATAAKIWHGKTLTYGLDGGDLCAEFLNNNTIVLDSLELPLPLPGRHNAINYLAALAVGKVLGIDWKVLKEGLSVQLPDGRSHRYDLPNDIVILDETYNAGLESMLAGLRLLADTPGKRRIAVLGRMKELGERSIDFHRQVGRATRDLQLDALFVFADFEEAAAMATGAAGLPFVEIGDITAENGREDLAQRLLGFVEKGDRILFKASHSVELNRVVEKVRAGLAGEE